MTEETLYNFEEYFIPVFEKFNINIDRKSYCLEWILRVDPDGTLYGLKSGKYHYVLYQHDNHGLSIESALSIIPSIKYSVLAPTTIKYGEDNDSRYYSLAKVVSGWSPQSNDYYFES